MNIVSLESNHKYRVGFQAQSKVGEGADGCPIATNAKYNIFNNQKYLEVLQFFKPKEQYLFSSQFNVDSPGARRVIFAPMKLNLIKSPLNGGGETRTR